MKKIKILPDEVANRIAAGEVIERPASVVKECVENSIDAGATEIIIKIVNGGRDMIQIVDNGHGMSEEDAFLAFERHATSKISSADDIVHISTMGFRGEALPSIASVSIFQMITKTEHDDIATEINFKGGRLDSVQKTAAKTGTSITVKNIFFNVPARRKFLKSEPVENKHILNYIHYQSVLFPNISFIFFHNGKEKLNYPITNSIKERMLDIFGTSFENQRFIFFSKEFPFIKISGYLQEIRHTEQKNLLDTHYIFVNRRFINDKTIYSAIKNGYEPFLAKYRFFEGGKLPNYIIFIDINPEEIDVNVHPAKTEIRFRNNSAVYGFVKDAVYESLLKELEQTTLSRPDSFPIGKSFVEQLNHKSPVINNEKKENDINLNWNPKNDFLNPVNESSGSTQNRENTVTINKPPSSYEHRYNEEITNPYLHDRQTESASPISQNSSSTLEILNTLKEDYIPLWQLHNTYIFIQVEDGFIAIDQHAAHERILFEKLLKNIDNKRPNRQKLVFPLVIDLPNYLSENIKNLITENEETLGNLGFVVKSFSGNSIVIDEIPSELDYWDGGNIFVEILEQLQDEMNEIKDFRIASAMSVACKGSIKAGKKLTKREMHELINELFTCKFPYQCPHGRPLIIKITLREIEKLFKRIV
ncbi:MAG: DNA mismatch repair endonuclease MutL [Candidatus Cloacimonetes bacterium]|nr:DNA mismatch repair endonuclease MutL [Candidatus Cloacimonadota bacterium]